jgi:hypothetical protein
MAVLNQTPDYPTVVVSIGLNERHAQVRQASSPDLSFIESAAQDDCSFIVEHLMCRCDSSRDLEILMFAILALLGRLALRFLCKAWRNVNPEPRDSALSNSKGDWNALRATGTLRYPCFRHCNLNSLLRLPYPQCVQLLCRTWMEPVLR